MREFLEIMENLSEEKRKYLQELFKNVPYWMLEEIHVCNFPKKKAFVRSGEVADRIYILLDGKVKATELQRYEFVYDYTLFEAIHVFGEMEFYGGYENYISTLVTTTPCLMLEIRKDFYVKWMRKDTVMLLSRVQTMLRDLLDQSQKERIFVFLSGIQRMYYLLVKMFREYAKDGILEVRSTKEELANLAGIDIRTVNRAIKKMIEDGLLVKDGRTIIVNQIQYEEMNRILQTMIDKNGGNENGKEKDNSGL